MNANLSLSPDELTLHLIATGLLKMARMVDKGKAFSLPYPSELQLGLDRLVVSSLSHARTPPLGVPDLLSWSLRPLEEWPLTLPEHHFTPSDTLLDGQIPTSLCDTWALASSDIEAELTEQKLLLSVLNVCQSARAPRTYVALRRLFIEHPVLTSFELQRTLLEQEMDRVAEHIRNAYEPAPAACMAPTGELYCCGDCGNLLLRTLSGGLICEEERCRRKHARGTANVGRTLYAKDEVFWLKRGIRRFIAAPGRAELRLEKQLQKRGLSVELWPAFDRYDLRVLFPDGEVWAADVKDWADPCLLARRINTSAAPPIPHEPVWTRAYFVFPTEREAERPDYVRAFLNQSPNLPKQIHAAFERKFLADVGRKLKGCR